MPDTPIIDAHLHLTDPARLRYPWMDAVPALHREWSLDDYDRRRGGVAVQAMVFVEVDVHPADRAAEVGFVTRTAAADPRLAAMVAAVAMDQGAATGAALDALPRPLVRGVRHLIQGHVATPGYACRPEMVAGVRMLGERGLGFDLCILHPQMRDATALVDACPGVTFILDHLGKPGIRAGLMDPWREDLRALAARPNVACKISGAVTEADHAGWTEAQVMPYLTHAMDVFGADRVMFGGDWPVSELATTYARWVALVEDAVRPFGSAFAERLWRGTARDIYRLA